MMETEVVTDLSFQPSQMGEVYSRYTATVVSQTGGGVGPGRSVDFTTPQESKCKVQLKVASIAHF